ncbi:hypothetical protein LN042_09255 [Kitasatospora sp. RB6PN24]|uniref:hypothetical protein n=1 Tax=Kitasatospora humi TaxID=2893891 RepID=UPI001E3550BF|nr:hypothetical protein [Kitasatospora humi]MCC9307287.1 hypothetical protein [Kitasatospora humi]
MPFEDDFSNALREAADASEPPPVQLMAAGAAQRGRRTKRRRAILTATASVAVLAVAGTLAVQSPPASSHSAVTDLSAAASVSASASVDPKPVTGDQMLALFKSKLPAGLQLSAPRSQGTEQNDAGAVQMALAAYTAADGQGKGTVEITVTRQKADLNTKDLACDSTWQGCTRTRQADGSYLRLDLPPKADGSHPDQGAAGSQLWAVQLQRPDGTVVTASSSNIPAPGQGSTMANGPFLTADQLKALALDPVWPQVGAALGAPHDVPDTKGSPTEDWVGLPYDDILRTAAPLLPSGLTEQQIPGVAKDAGFGSFLVDDGHGKSLIRVAVEDWSVYKQNPFDPPIDGEFTNAAVLPNGDKLISGTDSHYKGEVRNFAEVLTPQHLMVVVESFNGTSFTADEVTRSQPALSVDQVKAIATSPTWHGPAK